MNKLRKAETGEEEKEGDKEQEKIEGRRRRGKKKKQGISDLEVENSEMGCETQYERENQEEPGVTKGDTQKFQIFGGKQVFVYVFLVGAHQPKLAQKREEKTITCDMLQNTGG